MIVDLKQNETSSLKVQSYSLPCWGTAGLCCWNDAVMLLAVELGPVSWRKMKHDSQVKKMSFCK